MGSLLLLLRTSGKGRRLSLVGKDKAFIKWLLVWFNGDDCSLDDFDFLPDLLSGVGLKTCEGVNELLYS